MIKTVIITGGSRGIGRATAEIFAKNGYDIVFSYNKSSKEAHELEKEFPCCFGIKADFNKQRDIELFCEKAVDRLNHIDVVVNNVGIAKYGLLTDTSCDDWDEIMNVNLKAMFLVCKKLLPFMTRRQFGAIVNVSSMWGITGGSCEVAYSASKGGVIAFTKALAKEVGPSKITVNAVAPGVIKTDMMKKMDEKTLETLKMETPVMELGTPQDVAQAILFLAQNRFITGHILSVDGGMTI